MNIDLEAALFILYILISLDILIAISIGVRFLKIKTNDRRSQEMSTFLNKKIISEEENQAINFLKKNRNVFMRVYIDLRQSNSLDHRQRKKIIEYIKKIKIDKHYHSVIRSRGKYDRIRSAICLGYLPSDKNRKVLEKALVKEKNFSVKLYMLNALTMITNPDSLETMVNSIKEAPGWYRKKATILISEFGEKFHSYLPKIIDSELSDIQHLIIHFASKYIAEDLKKYLIDKSRSEDKDIAYAALRSLSELYVETLNTKQLLQNEDPKARNIAIEAVSRIPAMKTISSLIPALADKESQKFAAFSISVILRNNPKYLNSVIDLFRNEKDKKIKAALAEILSEKIEYLIMKFHSDEKQNIKCLIKEIVLQNKTNGLIGFLNKNRDVELENEFLEILKDVMATNEGIKNELCTYLNNRLIKKLKADPCVLDEKPEDLHQGKHKVHLLYVLLFAAILIFPLIFILRHFNLLGGEPLFELTKIYIIDFNYYLVYYLAAVNLTYLLLMLFAFIGVRIQVRQWLVKKMTFLFKKNMLPSISIIAPAYNEEAGIIESINSLLTLRYPDYDLIVINDGSTDNTLNKVINHYNLEKVELLIDENLPTQPVRGVYKNKSFPKFVVVDKANGGKADSLNVGINISKNEYVCGIDSDSLLESDSLLKVIAPLLDSEVETVASGGNIYPINGCTVSKGMLVELNIPKNHLPRFQTIEYLRAFMVGRIGWTYLNCLLIISGAFGLFNRRRLIEIGGYLTRKGRYHKDTVGEDMELVVRLGRQMREKKLKHNIVFSFNAHCWTEVPDDFKILYRQRDRWQRGLIDILTYHKKILFNRSYGRMGFIGMPYYFIFEFLGPLLETQGYVMVILAAILGLLNPTFALLLFISSIMLGTLVSLSSLIISMRQLPYYKFKEMLILVFYAIIENFGFRQLVSFWRVVGYFNSMKKPKGWGKMARKGFAVDSAI